MNTLHTKQFSTVKITYIFNTKYHPIPLLHLVLHYEASDGSGVGGYSFGAGVAGASVGYSVGAGVIGAGVLCTSSTDPATGASVVTTGAVTGASVVTPTGQHTASAANTVGHMTSSTVSVCA
jgi:hypothetical protein